MDKIVLLVTSHVYLFVHTRLSRWNWVLANFPESWHSAKLDVRAPYVSLCLLATLGSFPTLLIRFPRYISSGTVSGKHETSRHAQEAREL